MKKILFILLFPLLTVAQNNNHRTIGYADSSNSIIFYDGNIEIIGDTISIIKMLFHFLAEKDSVIDEYSKFMRIAVCVTNQSTTPQSASQSLNEYLSILLKNGYVKREKYKWRFAGRGSYRTDELIDYKCNW